MSSFELVSLVLMVIAAITIVALLGPASLGALLGAGVALAAMRIRGTGRS